MARITVEDCLHNCENRFELTLLAAKRARQLSLGKDDPLVKRKKNKWTVIALREIANNLIDQEYIDKIEARVPEIVLPFAPLMEEEDFLE